jgi:hypothetical protein
MCWAPKTSVARLSVEPGIHPLLQNVQRQSTGAQEFIVECTHVEAVAERTFRLRPQRLDLQLADLVGECLAGHDNITIDLVDDIVFGFGGIVLEEVDRLLTRPALVVDARVDDVRAPKRE